MDEQIESQAEGVKSENIFLWAFNVLEYDKLRKIPGCKLLELYAVELD